MRTKADGALWRRIWAGASTAGLLLVSTAANGQVSIRDTTGLPPPGYGRFSQEEISVRLETPRLSVIVTPLHPVTLRLLPRDAHGLMEGLLQANDAAIHRVADRTAAREPGLLLVSFYGKENRTRFNPTDISVTTASGLLRPREIIPVTPRWTDGEVARGEVMRAIYVMDRELDVLGPLRFTYGTTADDSWSSRLPGIENELARARGRAAADRNR